MEIKTYVVFDDKKTAEKFELYLKNHSGFILGGTPTVVYYSVIFRYDGSFGNRIEFLYFNNTLNGRSSLIDGQMINFNGYEGVFYAGNVEFKGVKKLPY